jgi:glucose-1-phosphate thymidylyltransferase
MGRGYCWFDTGLFSSLLEAGQFIQTIQKRQGQAVCCPEEIAFHQGWISRSDLLDQAKSLSKNEYGEYLKDIASE